jgi:hypothetical protein
MARTFDSPRHQALRDFLVEKRKEADLRQVDLAKRLKRRQGYISYVETGQKLVEVVGQPKPVIHLYRQTLIKHGLRYFSR